MKVIPVLDVKDGLTVWAKMGFRDLYKPIRSRLYPFSNPLATVKKLSSLGFKTVYVADLGAILYGFINTELYKALSSEVNLIVDPGVKSVEEASSVTDAGVWKLVVATETLPKLEIAQSILEVYGCDRVVLSLDLKNREILSKILGFKSLPPKECLEEFVKLGFEEVIVVDLARVGSHSGPDFELIRELKTIPIKLIVGGGVRNLNDLLILREMNIEAALVASALHQSKLTVYELKRAGFL
ncbi:MAG: HisA/HisF-related TIM barrel protein [Candidatus Bathyarchaeia archaeon]